MDDRHQVIEQRALRRVRGLFERLERNELGHRRRQKYLLVGAFVSFALLLGIIYVNRPIVPSQAAAQLTSCELDAWNAKAAEFERSFRLSNPQMSYREVQTKLEHERPFFMAAARVDCKFKRTDAK